MIEYEDDYILIENKYFALAHTYDYQLLGFCFLDKYCWTKYFGFETLE